jgi:hypothetical protein
MNDNREAEKLANGRLRSPTRASVDEFEDTLVEEAERDAEWAIERDERGRHIEEHPDRGFEVRE